MALKRLQTGEMITLSGAWIDKKGEACKLLQSIKQVVVLLPLIEEAHAGLLSSQPAPADVLLAKLMELAGRKDDRHDDLVRCIYHLLTALAFAAVDTQERERYLALRDRLLPQGLDATRNSYREEAGQVELMKSRIDAGDKKLMSEIPLPGGGDLQGVVSELITVGRELGVLEGDRAKALAKQSLATSGSDAVAARNQWIRVTNALIANLELAKVGEAAMQEILGPLRVAEKAADRRAGRREEEAPPVPPPVPPEGGTGEPK